MTNKAAKDQSTEDLISDPRMLETLRFRLDLDGDVERSYDEQIKKKGSLASVLADDPKFDERQDELIIGEKWGDGSFMPTVINGHVHHCYEETDVKLRAGEIDFKSLVTGQIDLLTDGDHLTKDERVTMKGLRKAVVEGADGNMKMLEAIEPIGQRLDRHSGEELEALIEDFKSEHGQDADELPAIDKWIDDIPAGSATEAANAAGVIYGLYLRKERDERVASATKGAPVAQGEAR